MCLVCFFFKSVFLLLGLSVGGASKQLFYNMVRKYTAAAATAAAHGYCVHGIVSQFLAGKKETEIETDNPYTHICIVHVGRCTRAQFFFVPPLMFSGSISHSKTCTEQIRKKSQACWWVVFVVDFLIRILLFPES